MPDIYVKYSDIPEGSDSINDDDIIIRSSIISGLLKSRQLTGLQLKAAFASISQGLLAESAVQPEDLGSAAFESATEFAPSSHIGSGGSQHANATTSSAGFMSAADKAKLGGIAAGATVNSSDATLLNRSNHTGTQAISTVSGLQTELDNKAPLAHVGSNGSLAHALSTTSEAGFMSPSQVEDLNKIKLLLVAES